MKKIGYIIFVVTIVLVVGIFTKYTYSQDLFSDEETSTRVQASSPTVAQPVQTDPLLESTTSTIIQQSSSTVTQPIDKSVQQTAEEIKKDIKKKEVAPPKPKDRATVLAVLNFVPIGVSTTTAYTVSDLLRTAMYNLDVFVVKERIETRRIFEENKIHEIPACEDTVSALKYGKMLRVDKIVYGTIDKLSDKVILNAKIADLKTKTVEFAGRDSYSRESDLDKAVDNFALKLSSAIEKREIELRKLAVVKEVVVSTPTVKTKPKIKEMIGKDGIPMMYVSSGMFTMGSSAVDAKINEKPAHEIFLKAFYIDKYEVTNAQYNKFVEATNRHRPLYCNTNTYCDDNLPVVGVSWNDARAYAAWAGERLPTEAEWEKAARGTDMRVFPWGNEWFVNEKYPANCKSEKDGYRYTAPVNSFEDGQSPYDCYNMAGNVWEWCNDWYGASYYRESSNENPKGPMKGVFRVIRGGSWFNPYSSCRVTERSSYRQDSATTWIGFRCVKDAK